MAQQISFTLNDGKLNFSVRNSFGTGTDETRSVGRRISIKMVIWTFITATIGAPKPDILRRSRMNYSENPFMIPFQVFLCVDFGDFLDGDGSIEYAWWGILRDFKHVFLEFSKWKNLGREFNFQVGN